MELTWNAPATCPEASKVIERIRALAGREIALGVQLQAAATITRAGTGYQLRLVMLMDGLRAERQLEARSCDDLVGATAVNIALLLKEPAPLTAAEPTPSIVPSLGGSTEPQVAAVPPARAPTARARTIAGVIQAPRMSLALGPMPQLSVGVSLAGGLAIAHWRVLAGGTLWLQHTPEGGRPDTGARIDRFQAGLHVCRAFSHRRYGLAPCLSVSVEHLRARGTGAYVRDVAAEATWLAAGPGLQARVALKSWLSLLVSIDLKLQTTRPTVSIDGVGRIAELGWLAAEMSFGCEWFL